MSISRIGLSNGEVVVKTRWFLGFHYCHQIDEFVYGYIHVGIELLSQTI